MSGRLIDRNSMAEAKRTAECIAHRNMLIGYALREKLNEEKANKMKHQRKDIINVKRGDE